MFKKAINIKPGYAEALKNMESANRKMDEARRTIETCERTLKSFSKRNDPDALYELSYAYFWVGEYRKQIEVLERLIKIDFSFGGPIPNIYLRVLNYARLGYAYELIGDRENAKKYYLEADKWRYRLEKFPREYKESYRESIPPEVIESLPPEVREHVTFTEVREHVTRRGIFS